MPEKFYVIQRGYKYLTPSGGWSPRLNQSKPFQRCESAQRILGNRRATINQVQPQDCKQCGFPHDPIMGRNGLCALCVSKVK